MSAELRALLRGIIDQNVGARGAVGRRLKSMVPHTVWKPVRKAHRCRRRMWERKLFRGSRGSMRFLNPPPPCQVSVWESGFGGHLDWRPMEQKLRNMKFQVTIFTSCLLSEEVPNPQSKFRGTSLLQSSPRLGRRRPREIRQCENDPSFTRLNRSSRALLILSDTLNG